MGSVKTEQQELENEQVKGSSKRDQIKKKRKVEDDGGDDQPPLTQTEVEKNEVGESYIKLSDYRRITVREFKGKTLVDIRDFYKDKTTNELKPGAKGISLSVDQWRVLCGSIDTINDLIDQA